MEKYNLSHLVIFFASEQRSVRIYRGVWLVCPCLRIYLELLGCLFLSIFCLDLGYLSPSPPLSRRLGVANIPCVV